MRRARVVQGGVALILTVGVIGCATIIDATDDTIPIAEAFCKCGDGEDLSTAWPGEECIRHVDGRLSSADPKVRSAWIELFSENDCEKCTNEKGRALCKNAEPICAAPGGACGSTDVCCKVPGKTVYCGAAKLCVAEAGGECTPPFQPCDPANANCCGQTGFQGGCVEQPAGDYICLETCDQADAANCPGCCGFYGYKDASGAQSQTLCFAGDDCAFVCDPKNGDECPEGFVCHPAIDRQNDAYFGVDGCLEACDPDANDSCAKDTCCVRFRDEVAGVDVGRCLGGLSVCANRCAVKNKRGTASGCGTLKLCQSVLLAPAPTGTFSIFQCVKP